MIKSQKICFIVFIVLILLNNYANAQKNTCKIAKLDSVIIFEFTAAPDRPFPYERISIINRPFIIDRRYKKAVLNNKEQKRLNDFLASSSSFNNGTSICWEPHLGIVYYKTDKVANYFEVCMAYNRMMSTLKVGKVEHGRPAGLKGIYMPAGMSKQFRRFINDLLGKYKFANHKNSMDSMYDE